MANSTLSPGKPSEAIVRLREAALRDMERAPEGVSAHEDPSFDHAHSSATPAYRPEDHVPETPYGNNPHVGNGRGPIG